MAMTTLPELPANVKLILRADCAGWLPCSSGEGQLLRIAGSLAEGIPVDLRDALSGLDTINTGLVARAICHAAGHRPYTTTRATRKPPSPEFS